MSSLYSVPNICDKAIERLCLSRFSSDFKKLFKACCGSAAISAAILSAERPIALKPSWNLSPCTWAVCNFDNKALIAVAATSGGLPSAIMASASAAASSAAKPNCLALPPMRVMAATMSFSLAAVLLPSRLMASPSSSTPSRGKSNTLVSLAAASAAASAPISNATAILPAISVNWPSFSSGMPNWPPCAAISATASGTMPNSKARFLIWPLKASICWGVPSTTFFTPAMARSNSIASLVT